MNLEEIKTRAHKLYKQGTRLDNKGQRPQRVEKVLQRAVSMDPFNLGVRKSEARNILQASLKPCSQKETTVLWQPSDEQLTYRWLFMLSVVEICCHHCKLVLISMKCLCAVH